MNEFIFEENQFFTTDKLENLAQAQASCADKNASIANLSGLNYKNFVKAFLENQVSELRNYILRIEPLDNGSDCYGLVNVSLSNVDKGLSGNAADVCKTDHNFAYKYNTLCSRQLFTNTSDIYIAISLSIVAIFAVFGFITYLKRPKTKSIDLEEGEVRKIFLLNIKRPY